MVDAALKLQDEKSDASTIAAAILPECHLQYVLVIDDFTQGADLKTRRGVTAGLLRKERGQIIAVVLRVRATAHQAAAPSHNSVNWMMTHPWHHVAGRVSDQQFAQDKAKCEMTANLAPPDAGTAWLKFDMIFMECLEAAGYAPEP